MEKENKTTKWSKFIGMMGVKESDNENTRRIKDDWNTFVKAFWAIFLFKISTKGLAIVGNILAEEETLNIFPYLLLWGSQFIPVLLMVGAMGYYAFKLSKKKVYILFGVLGFIWFAFIGIFLGYIALNRIARNELKKVEIIL